MLVPLKANKKNILIKALIYKSWYLYIGANGGRVTDTPSIKIQRQETYFCSVQFLFHEEDKEGVRERKRRFNAI